jgi:hypothetical protein
VSGHCDRTIESVRRVFARVCPAAILERIVDQSLADLVDDRARAADVMRRTLVTIGGVARLCGAVALSMVVLREQWWSALRPVAVDLKQCAEWLLLMTLVAMLRDGFTSSGYQKLHVFWPSNIVWGVEGFLCGSACSRRWPFRSSSFAGRRRFHRR